MATSIEFNNVSKLYQIGQVSSGTLIGDFKRWWTMNIKGEEDPFRFVAETNRRDAAAENDYIWALKDISFKLEQGEVLGITGKNGAGKSTLMKILAKITAPTTGTVKIRGRIGSLLEVGTGFHPDMTGRENVFLNGAILGMTTKEIKQRLDEIVDFSGCERFFDTPVKRYSSGMKMRLGFSVASFLRPDILLVDEALAVGDMEFRQKAIAKMKEMAQSEGRTVIFVSHFLSAIKQLCHSGMVLDSGKLTYFGNINEAIDHYLGSIKVAYLDSELQFDMNRKGNGDLRFKSIHLFSKNMTERDVFSVGEECRIRIDFEANERLKQSSRSRISVVIRQNENRIVAWLSSSMFTQKIDSESGVIQFRIPKLMLTEGTYTIALTAFDDRNEADFIGKAAQFEVIYHDYFGTGMQPVDAAYTGNAFLDYSISWED